MYIHFNRWVYQNGLPRGGVYGHAVVKVLLGGTHLHSHTKALVKKSIAKYVSQLFDLPEFQRIDNDARELATLLPAVRIVESFGRSKFSIARKSPELFCQLNKDLMGRFKNYQFNPVPKSAHVHRDWE